MADSFVPSSPLGAGIDWGDEQGSTPTKGRNRRERAIEFVPSSSLGAGIDWGDTEISRSRTQRFIEDPITKGAEALGLGQLDETQIDPAGRAEFRRQQEEQGQRIVARRKELGVDDANPVMRTWSNLASGAAGTVGSTAQFIGAETGLRWLEDFGKGAQEEAAALKPTDAKWHDDAVAGFGSVLTFMPAGMGAAGAVLKSAQFLLNSGRIGAAGAATAIKMAPWAAAAFSTALESAGVAQEAYDQGMAEHGNKELARSRAWIAGMWSAPVVFVTDRLGIFGDSKGALKLLGTFMSEGTQEGSQRVLTNIAGYQPAGEGAAYDALIGGLAGGGIASIQVAVDKWSERNAKQGDQTGGKDLAVDVSRPMPPEDLLKAAQSNPNMLAGIALKANNLNDADAELLLQKMAADGYGELAASVARASETDAFIKGGELLESQMPDLYKRIDEAVETYLRTGTQQQQPQATVATPDQTVAPTAEAAVAPVQQGQELATSPPLPNSPDAAIDQRLSQQVATAFPEPAPTAEQPVAQQPAQPATAEQVEQPMAVAPDVGLVEQGRPKGVVLDTTKTPSRPQEQLLSAMAEDLASKFGAIDPASIRLGKPDTDMLKMAASVKQAMGVDILFVESDGIKLADGTPLQKGAFLGYNLRGQRAIVVNLKRGKDVAIKNTIGHELTHQLEELHPEIFAALQKAAMQRISSGQAKYFKGFLTDAISQEMQAAGQTLSPEQLSGKVKAEQWSEVPAEVVGEMFQDSGFWAQAFRMAPDSAFVKRMVSTLKGLFDRLQRAFTSNGFVRGVRDINAMRTAVATAFQQWEQAEKAVPTKELVEAKTGVSKQAAPLPKGVSQKEAAKQRAAKAKEKAERVQGEAATKAYGIKDEPVTETPMTRLAEGKPEPKPVNIPEKIETAPASFQREQVLSKMFANIPVSERDLKKHPSVAKVWNELEVIRVKAKELHPEFSKLLTEISSLVGGTPMIPGIKGSGRAMEKIWTDYKGDTKRLKDALRATVIVRDPHLIFDQLKALVESRFPGAKFKRNGWAPNANPSPTHYRDIFWNVTYKGLTAEIQANTIEMFNAKEFGEGHKHYETIRVLEQKKVDEGRLDYGDQLKLATAIIRSRPIYDAASATSERKFRKTASSISTPSSSKVVSLKGRGSLPSQAKTSMKPGLRSTDVTGTPMQSQNRVPAGNLVSAISTSVPNGSSAFQRAVTEEGHTVVGTTGKLVGSPGWVTSQEQLGEMRQNLKRLQESGKVARFWYENSSKAILDMFNGDKVAAEKFVGLLAIFSQDATVAGNTSMALNAYYQWLTGQKIKGVHFPSQNAKAQAWLDSGKDWGGIKTNNFYINLMAEIDPSKITDEATMDLWMKRAFGYESAGGQFGPQQYGFMLRETQRLARELGWTPHQVQDAIWTGIKSEVEKTEPDTAGLSFADTINDRQAQISWEAQPGETVGVLPGLQTAPIEQKFAYFNAVHDQIYKDGVDLIAQKIGLPHGKQITGYSAWKGNIGAGGQVFMPVRIEGQGAKRKVGGNSAALLNLYSALKGYILSQEAVVWHHPIYSPAMKSANGIDLMFGRALNVIEMRQLYSAIHDRFGTWELAPGYTPSGARILNFTDITNKEFQAGIEQVVQSLPEGFGGGIIDGKAYRSDGDYISNDWEQFPDGRQYLERIQALQADIGQAGRSDLQAWADELRAGVETVNKSFSDKYGWGEWRQPQTRAAGFQRQADQGVGTEGVPDGKSEANPLRTREQLTKAKQLKRNLGKCHALSGRMVAFDPEDRYTLVLAVVNGAPFAPIKIWHSMVKDPVTGNVYDPINERWMTPELARDVMGFEPIIETKPDELRKQIAKNRIWTDQTILKPRGWELDFLQRGDYDVDASIFAEPNDNEAQLAYLQQRAQEAGAANVDEWLASKPEEFDKAAAQWRMQHPTVDGLSTNSDKVSGFSRQYTADELIALDTSGVPQAGKEFLVLRLSSHEGLYGVNAANIYGQAKFMDMMDDFERPSQADFDWDTTKIFVYVAKANSFGKYRQSQGGKFAGKDMNDTGPVGVSGEKDVIWYSFPGNGDFTAELVGVLDTDNIRATVEKLEPESHGAFDLAGWNATATAIKQEMQNIEPFDLAAEKERLKAKRKAEAEEKKRNEAYDNPYFANPTEKMTEKRIENLVNLGYDAIVLRKPRTGEPAALKLDKKTSPYWFQQRYDFMQNYGLQQTGSAIVPIRTEDAATAGFQRADTIPVAQRKYEDMPYLTRRAMAAGFADVQEWRRAQPWAFTRAVKEAAETSQQMPLFQRQVIVTPATASELSFVLGNDAGRSFGDIAIVKSRLVGGTPEQRQLLADSLRSDYGDLGIDVKPALKRAMLALAERIAAPLPAIPASRMSDEARAEIKSAYIQMGMSEADAEATINAAGFQRQQPIAGARFNLPGETRLDVAQKLIQDKAARIANVQRTVTEQGGTVAEPSNVYLAEERFYGTSAYKLEQAKKKIFEPLLERIGASGVEMSDIALYSYALHAPERNAWIASINPQIPDGGSGMTNAEAAKVMATFANDPQLPQIQQFAKEFRDITKMTQKVMLNAGLVTPSVVAGWNSRSQNYVPLKGFENIDELGQRGAGTGTGFDVRGPESRRAKGRESKAGQILEKVIFDYERAVIRAEKNKVGKALLNFILANPDPKLWQVNKIQPMAQFYKNGAVNIHGLLDGEVRYINQTVQNPDETIIVKHYGQEYALWIKDPAMLESLKGPGGMIGAGSEAASHAMRAWGAVNRTLAKAWTAWNPVFTTINFTRDFVTGMIHSANVGGVKYAAKIAADLFPMMAGIRQVERGGNETSPAAKMYMQYQEDGGKTGFYIFGDMEERIKNINALVEDARKNQGVKGAMKAALKAMHAVENVVMDYNAIVENAIRVSAYKNALEIGKTRAEASSIAKNLTVNFNRKGQLTSKFAAWYLFFNPSVQGVARMAQAAKNNPREFSVAIGSMVAMGIMFGLLAADDKDDEGVPYWDRIPAYEKQRSLILMTGDGNRITIPMPYGYGYFVSLGYGIADLIRGRPVGTVALDQMNSMTQHFSPLGGGDDPLMALTPTIATPFVEQWANKRLSGQPLMPDEEKISGMPIPDSERYWGSTRGTAVQQFTEWLNEATGGTKITPGAVSVSPETLKNYIRFATGGAGTFLTDAMESAYVTQEIDWEAAQQKNIVPFLRQWYRYDDVRDDVAYYSEAKRKALTALEEAKKYYDSDRPEVLERMGRNRGMAALGGSIRYMEQAMRNLRLQEIAIKENKTMSTEEKYRAKVELDQQKEQLLEQWNASFYRAEEESRK